MLLAKMRLLNKVTGQKLTDIIKLLQFGQFRVFLKKLSACSSLGGAAGRRVGAAEQPALMWKGLGLQTCSLGGNIIIMLFYIFITHIHRYILLCTRVSAIY